MNASVFTNAELAICTLSAAIHLDNGSYEKSLNDTFVRIAKVIGLENFDSSQI